MFQVGVTSKTILSKFKLWGLIFHNSKLQNLQLNLVFFFFLTGHGLYKLMGLKPLITLVIWMGKEIILDIIFSKPWNHTQTYYTKAFQYQKTKIASNYITINIWNQKMKDRCNQIALHECCLCLHSRLLCTPLRWYSFLRQHRGNIWKQILSMCL